MKADKIIKPRSLKEAYEILMRDQKATVVGGGLFLRLQKKHFTTLIDCSDLLDDKIIIEDNIIIGPMTSLRAIEKNNDLPQGLRQSVKQISAIGVRNVATIGGSVYGRYPFSDINTMLVALDAQLEFYNAGIVSMRQYNEKGLNEKDILLSISFEIPKVSASSYFKKVYTDFSVINLSISDQTLAIGARPKRPVFIDKIDYDMAASDIISSIEFGSDFKASSDYRRALCVAKLEDMLQEIGGLNED